MALLILILSGTVSCDRDQPERNDPPRPNIILINTDDQRPETIDYLPTLRSLLADKGAFFARHVVTTPVCDPSRASLLRGQYAHNHRIHTNAFNWETGFKLAGQAFHHLGYEEKSLPAFMKKGGYRTILIGKYFATFTRRDYKPPCWDEFHAWLGDSDKYFHFRMNENGREVAYDDDSLYETDVLTRKAVSFIRSGKEASIPFFMYMAPNAAHPPYLPAPRHKDAFQDARAPRPPSFNEEDMSDKPRWLRNQQEMSQEVIAGLDRQYRSGLETLIAVDEMVGHIIQALDAVGQLNNTYIIYTSDNGMRRGVHRLPGGKLTAYEEDILVPLIIQGPGIPAKKIHEITANIDIMPTILELAGIPVPDFVDGRSLKPLLRDADKNGLEWRRAVLVEGWPPFRETLSWPGDNGVIIPPRFSALRTAQYKFVDYATEPDPPEQRFVERELYDLGEDPHEMENSYDAADSALKDRLVSWLGMLKDCRMESCRKAENQAGELPAFRRHIDGQEKKHP